MRESLTKINEENVNSGGWGLTSDGFKLPVLHGIK
jgi:hypothetical protein